MNKTYNPLKKNNAGDFIDKNRPHIRPESGFFNVRIVLCLSVYKIPPKYILLSVYFLMFYTHALKYTGPAMASDLCKNRVRRLLATCEFGITFTG